ELISIKEALLQAKQINGTIALLDMGDNVGGGSPGDSTALMRELISEPDLMPALVCLYDPEAQAKATEAGLNGELILDMGAKTLAGNTLQSEHKSEPVQS